MPQSLPIPDGVNAKLLLPIPRVWKGDPDINVGRVWTSFIGEVGTKLAVNFYAKGRGWRSGDLLLDFENEQESYLVDPWEGESVIRIVRLTEGAAGVLIEAVLR